MKDILISVIVPIYNAEKTLDKCVRSLLDQTYKEIEIILVDDGSTDNSGKICDSYVQKYNNIKKYYKKNGGVSTARNFGIRHANGKYISFVDADDFLEVETYEKIHNVILEKKPDCIDFGWKYINDWEDVAYNLCGLEKEIILDRKIIEKDILPPLLNLEEKGKKFVYDFVTNKIFRLSIIQNENVYFNEMRKTWEDRSFLVEYLQYCNSYYSTDEYFYNYVSIPNSLSRQYDLQYFDIILQNYKKYYDWFGEMYDFHTQYVYNYWCKSIENMIVRSLKEENNKEVIRRNIHRVLNEQQVIDWYKNRKPENKMEKVTSKLVEDGNIEKVVNIYETIVNRQIKQEKRKVIKTKIYSLRKVFKK